MWWHIEQHQKLQRLIMNQVFLHFKTNVDLVTQIYELPRQSNPNKKNIYTRSRQRCPWVSITHFQLSSPTTSTLITCSVCMKLGACGRKPPQRMFYHFFINLFSSFSFPFSFLCFFFHFFSLPHPMPLPPPLFLLFYFPVLFLPFWQFRFFGKGHCPMIPILCKGNLVDQF